MRGIWVDKKILQFEVKRKWEFKKNNFFCTMWNDWTSFEIKKIFLIDKTVFSCFSFKIQEWWFFMQFVYQFWNLFNSFQNVHESMRNGFKENLSKYRSKIWKFPWKLFSPSILHFPHKFLNGIDLCLISLESHKTGTSHIVVKRSFNSFTCACG